MMYKVGDKVRVRSDLKYGGFYGDRLFIGEMKYFIGKYVTIKEVCENSRAYKIEETCFEWTDEMFEGLAGLSTGDILNELAKNPKARFKSDINDMGKYVIVYCRNNYFRFDFYDSSGYLFDEEKGGGKFNGNLRIDTKWTLMQPEPKPIPFMEAFTANRNGKTIQCNLRGKRIFKSTYTGYYSTDEIEHGIWTIMEDES